MVKELTNMHKTLGSIRSAAKIKKRTFVSLAVRNKAEANNCSEGTA